MRPHRAHGSAALLALALAFAPVASAQSVAWRANGELVELTTDAGRERAAELAERAEVLSRRLHRLMMRPELREALAPHVREPSRDLWSPPDGDASRQEEPQPLRILALRRRRDFLDLLPQFRRARRPVHGAFLPAVAGGDVAFSLHEAPIPAPEVLAHELWHAHSHRRFPGLDASLDEALAETWAKSVTGSADVDPETTPSRHRRLAALLLKSIRDLERSGTAPGSGSPLRLTALEQADWLSVLGAFLARQGRPLAARRKLEQALAQRGDLPAALEGLALVELGSGNYEGALELFFRALQRGTLSEHGDRSAIAAALSARQRGTSADRLLPIVDLVVARRPRWSSAWVTLAEIAAREAESDRADYDEVVSYCRRAVAAEPDSGWLRLLLGRAHWLAHEREAALREAARATQLTLESGDATAANNLCWYGGVSGFAEQVAPVCELAVAMHPGSGLYRDSRGLVRALRGDLSGAAEDFRFFLDSPDADAAASTARRAWLESLQRGHMPFDESTLAELPRLPF